MAKSSWSCLLTKGNRKDPNQSFCVCRSTNQFSLWMWTGGSHLQPLNLITALGPDQQHLGFLMTTQQKQFVRKERAAHTEDRAGSHPEGGEGIGGQSTGWSIWSLQKVPTDTGILCTFLETVNSFSLQHSQGWIMQKRVRITGLTLTYQRLSLTWQRIIRTELNALLLLK